MSSASRNCLITLNINQPIKAPCGTSIWHIHCRCEGFSFYIPYSKINYKSVFRDGNGEQLSLGLLVCFCPPARHKGIVSQIGTTVCVVVLCLSSVFCWTLEYVFVTHTKCMVTFVFMYCFFVLGKNAFTEMSVLQGFAIAMHLYYCWPVGGSETCLLHTGTTCDPEPTVCSHNWENIWKRSHILFRSVKCKNTLITTI